MSAEDEPTGAGLSSKISRVEAELLKLNLCCTCLKVKCMACLSMLEVKVPVCSLFFFLVYFMEYMVIHE